MKGVIISVFMLIALTAFVAASNEDWCLQGVPAVYHNGVYWAWASPCDGGCSDASPETYGYDAKGWRYVSDDTEWALRPTQEAFMADGPLKCAASFFDPVFDHCDYGNQEVYQKSGDSKELWLVHDVCGEKPTGSTTSTTLTSDAVPAEIPEMPVIGAFLVLLAGLAVVVFKRQ